MEGELEKRIRTKILWDKEFTTEEFGTPIDSVWLNVMKTPVISQFDIRDWIDEARKEFPVMGWQSGIAHDLSAKEAAEVFVWFLKWFGDEK